MNVSVLNFALLIVGLVASATMVRLMAAHPGWGATVALSGLLATMITLVQPKAGLYLLIYSMLLSPGFAAGELADRVIQIRLDDVFLLLVFVAWFVITTLRREAMIGLEVPLVRPMLGYISVAVVSSLIAIMKGWIGYRGTFFYVLKYAEYYMLYYMAFHMITSFDKAKPYLLAGVVTAVAVLAFAYQVMASGVRPYCPFDISHGSTETATLAGYLMIVIGMSIGVVLYARDRLLQGAALALMLACVPPLLKTQSRATYLAAAAMLAAMVVFGRGKRLVLATAGIVAFYILPHLFSSYVQEARERVEYTFVAGGQEMNVELGGRKFVLEASAATRVRKWIQLVHDWIPQRPLLGAGVTGVGLVDTQIPRVIGETGLVGFGFWTAIMWGLLVRSRRVFLETKEPLQKGLAFGFLCVYIGLLFQSFGVNTFIVIRIMEPFWFLAAIVMRLYVELAPPAEKTVRRASAPIALRRAYT